MRKLWALGLIGCGQLPLPTPSVIEPTRGTSEVVYEAPAPVLAPPWKTTCTSATKLVRWRGTWGEVPTQALEPVTWGPRIANRSHASPSRSPAQLDGAIARHSHDVAQCWKWAAARGAPATRVELAVTVDPFGRTSDLAITTTTPNGELTHCLAQVLSGLALGGVTSHTSRMHATLDFERSNQPQWTSPPPRPEAAEPIAVKRVCVPVLENAPVDVVAAPPMIVSDADPLRVDPTTPTISMGCRVDQPAFENSTVRDAFRSNLGAFRTCYAEALARDASLTGAVVINAVFTPGGLPDRVTARGDGDDRFHACMVAATNELWLDPPPLERIVHFDHAFQLEPASPHPMTFDAVLEAGDGQTALAMAVFDVRSARDALGACRGRAGVVRALHVTAPWRDDPRTLAALRDLAAFVQTMRADDARSCLDDASDTLRELVLPSDADPRWDAPRLDIAFPLARYLRWQMPLRIAVAEQWVRGPRRLDGLAELHAITSDADPALAEDVRARIAQIGARRDLPINFCR